MQTEVDFTALKSIVDLHSYDKILIAFSAGKDSTACVLRLFDAGVPRDKIELWHHSIDGKPGTPVFMDWECTEDYCRKFAAAFGIKIYFSWKDKGFEGEMLRENALTKKTYFETPDGLRNGGGIRGKKSTRLKFPQVSPDLKVRWCSAYLKRDVFEFALNNQSRFHNSKTLVITGERAQESSARSKYKFFEKSRVDKRNGKLKRLVDHCRIIHTWTESDVWEIIERYGVVVHPCYYLGFARCSCKFCIFGNANQFATAYALSPANGTKIDNYEIKFNTTIKRAESIRQLIHKGKPYQGVDAFPEVVKQAISYQYTGKIFTNEWVLPLGAYGESDGPI